MSYLYKNNNLLCFLAVFDYLCVQNCEIMAEMRQLNLAQLKQLIEGKDEDLANNYISRNVAVARNVRLNLIKVQIVGQPTLMPEMRILIIKDGWAAPVINMVERRFEAGDLVFLGTNGILQYRDASSNVQGIGLSVSDELFSLAIGNRIPQAFDGHLRHFQLHLQPSEQEIPGPAAPDAVPSLETARWQQSGDVAPAERLSVVCGPLVEPT